MITLQGMTSSVLASLSDWLGLPSRHEAPQARASNDNRSYRLRAWPDLPDALRTARIYRMLSTMTVRPVTRTWMQLQSGMGSREIDQLLGELSATRALVTLGG